MTLKFIFFTYIIPTIIAFLRPILHVSPPNNAWINDPNGLFRDNNGLWHAYYQYHADVNGGNEKDWGHATSTDLWNWQHHPIAIPHDNTWGIWSGSVVIDTNSTSGFFSQGKTDGVVAIYTQYHLQEGWQDQAIAYSSDGGYTFHTYEDNPVLAIDAKDFRDPKVIWHQATEKWVMVVAYSADGVLGFYSSPHLKEWTWMSNFTSPNLPKRSNFECPALSRIPYSSVTGDPLNADGNDTWVLLASSGGGNPIYGGDGSVTRYLPGRFNGTHFIAIDDRADRYIDFGPDNYATTTFYSSPEQDGGAMLTMGWAANLAYAGNQPSGDREGWRGMLTSVREVSLYRGEDGEVRFHSFPKDLGSLKRSDRRSLRLTSDTNENISLDTNGAVLVDAQVHVLSDKPAPEHKPEPCLDITFKSSRTDETLICTLAFQNSSDTPSFSCDRGNALGGWTGWPADKMRAMGLEKVPRYSAQEQIWSVTALFDHSILEVFLNKGIAAGTMIAFPKEQLDTVSVRTSGVEGKLAVSVDVAELDSGSY